MDIEAEKLKAVWPGKDTENVLALKNNNNSILLVVVHYFCSVCVN